MKNVNDVVSNLMTVIEERKATVSFFMSVRPSTRNNSTPTGRIFMKFEYFSKIC
jgi:hypothetical protein